MLENYLLKQLIAFADNRTLSKAAQELHISQPALSKSMQKIEDEINVPLFNRSNRHIELNDAGKIAVKYARLAVQANETVISQTRDFYQAQRTINIGACNSLTLDNINKVILKATPALHTKMIISDDQELIGGLLHHHFDLVVIHQKIENSELTVKHYLDERLMVTVDQKSKLAKQKSLHFKDLAGMSILAHRSANFWLKICQNNIPNLNLVVQEKLSSISQIVKASVLPMFNSSLAKDLHEQIDNKVTLPIIDDSALTHYYIAYRKEDNQQLRDIIDVIHN